MSTIINATTTNGVVIQPDNSGSLVLQTNNGTTALTISTAQNATFAGTVAMSSSFLRNRIINGDMRIDQRNAGASVTVTDAYTLDRWEVRENTDGAVTAQQVTDAPTSFVNSVKITTTTADASLTSDQILRVTQPIEGLNIADLDFGTANAKTITLSFWVKGSITGTYAGVYANGSNNRSYIFTYTILAANTWEQKTVTIAGDTTGTWVTTSARGAVVTFTLGAASSYNGTANVWTGSDVRSVSGAVSVIGTLSATWQVTGVQLEIGTSATPFERRLYNQELANCQRYFEKSYELVTVPATNTYIGMVHVSAASNGFADMIVMLNFNVQKRATPTITFYREDGTSGSWNMERSGSSTTPTVNSGSVGDNGGRIYCATGANWTVASLKGHWTASAEL